MVTVTIIDIYIYAYVLIRTYTCISIYIYVRTYTYSNIRIPNASENLHEKPVEKPRPRHMMTTNTENRAPTP
jgi:hypothetical protein